MNGLMFNIVDDMEKYAKDNNLNGEKVLDYVISELKTISNLMNSKNGSITSANYVRMLSHGYIKDYFNNGNECDKVVDEIVNKIASEVKQEFKQSIKKTRKGE